MANTDNTQVQMKTGNNNPAESATTNLTASEVKRRANKSQVMQTDAPLIRYFDLTDEANYNYVLGYN